MTHVPPQAILVFPHLSVQDANAISSPFTHGFPSITAFTGLMWALERKLEKVNVPWHLHAVGVVCHHYQEQVDGTGRFYDPYTFNLRKPQVATSTQVRKLLAGTPPSIVEEGRIHLDITLIFTVSEKRSDGVPLTLVQRAETQIQQWVGKAEEALYQLRIAGGSLLPSRAALGRSAYPWMRIMADDTQERDRQFRKWRRQWLPGFALVGRDDLLADRLRRLRDRHPQASLLDAWLHASRFNQEPVPPQNGGPLPAKGEQRWEDPWRTAGSGWTVPIPVGYVALSPLHEAGAVLNARDATTPLRFVESVYSMGEWISPHRLVQLDQLLWHAETDEALGLYRCRNDYAPDPSQPADTDDAGQADDDDIYPYS